MKPNPREEIEALVAQANALVPGSAPARLPPMRGFPHVPHWHNFEHSVWSIGEQIRQAMNSQPKLRGDSQLYSEFLAVVRNRQAMRGRQSFVLLFAYRACIGWARELASLIPDPDIDGQVILTLYKMRATGFSRVVAPFLSSSTTWVRKETRRYIAFDLDAPIPHETRSA